MCPDQHEIMIDIKIEKSGTTIENFGKISKMTLSGEWPEVEVVDKISESAKPKLLHQLKDTEITVDFLHIPREMQHYENARDVLQRFLNEPPHKLSDEEIEMFRNTEKEYLDLQAETTRYGDLIMFKTYWNWLMIDRKQLRICHDASGNGTDCYEIIFNGQAAEFDENLALIEESLRSIE